MIFILPNAMIYSTPKSVPTAPLISSSNSAGIGNSKVSNDSKSMI